MKTLFTIIIIIIGFKSLFCQYSYKPFNKINILKVTGGKTSFFNNNNLNKGVSAFNKNFTTEANKLFFFSTGNHVLRAGAYNNIGVLKALENKATPSLYYFEKAMELTLGTSENICYNYFLSLAASGNNYEALLRSCDLEENIFPALNYNKALVYSGLKDYGNSSGFYRASIMQNIKPEESYFNLALDNFFIGDTGASSLLLSELINRKHKPYRPYLLSGIIKAQGYDFAESKKLLNKAFLKEPESINTSVALINAGAGVGSFTGLKKAYNNLKSIKQQDAIDLYAMGNFEFVKGRNNKAIRYYKRAAFKDTATSTYTVGVANVYNHSGEYKNAEKFYNEALSRNQKDLYAQTGLGINFFKQQNYSSASYHFSKAFPLLLRLQNGFNTHLAAGYSFYKTQNYLDAIIILSHIIGTDSTIDKAYGYRALVQYETEDLAGAFKDINKAIKINPNCNEYYELRGSIYQRSYQYKKAKKDYSKAVFLNPQSIFARNGLALALSMLGKAEHSLRVFNRLIKNEQISYLYNNRALVRDEVAGQKREKGKIELADSLFFLSVADIDIALEMDSQEWFRINRGNSLEHLGLDSLAEENYYGYYGSVALNNLGILEANNGDYEKSAELFRLAIKQDSAYFAPRHNITVLKNLYGFSSNTVAGLLDYPSFDYSKIDGINENKFYTTYYYYLPATLAATTKVDFIPEFLYKEIPYYDFELDYGMITNDMVIEDKETKHTTHKTNYRIEKFCLKSISKISSQLTEKKCHSYN